MAYLHDTSVSLPFCIGGDSDVKAVPPFTTVTGLGFAVVSPCADLEAKLVDGLNEICISHHTFIHSKSNVPQVSTAIQYIFNLTIHCHSEENKFYIA